MKKIISIITLTLIIQSNVSSQPCLPNGITFSTQTQINYPDCTEIEGYVSIHGDDITDLNGLNDLVSIGEYLVIKYNSNLNNLEGLNNLTSVGMFISIWYNMSLTSISALNNTAFSGVSGWQFVEIIGNDALLNLEGLNSIDTIKDRLVIESNKSLTSLTGLQNLKCITGSFQLDQNDALTNLEGLNNLNCVNAFFRITRNDALTNLEGLNNLTTLMRGFALLSNDSLLSLSGLNNLTNTKGIRIENNPMLTDITALANAESDFIQGITIKSNALLMNCDIESICNYLMLPYSDVDINTNASGCNSKEEVKAACTEGVSETSSKPVFTIYPNPATNDLFISSNNKVVNAVTIYNQLGQKIIFKPNPIDKVDISMLKQGIYIIELVTDELNFRQRLIIK